MLKEVGASGQISLGKKFAGQLFDVHFLETGEVKLAPMRVIPAVPSKSNPQAPDDQWAERHAHQIAAYNAWAEQSETFSDSVHAWRQSQSNNGAPE